MAAPGGRLTEQVTGRVRSPLTQEPAAGKTVTKSSKKRSSSDQKSRFGDELKGGAQPPFSFAPVILRDIVAGCGTSPGPIYHLAMGDALRPGALRAAKPRSLKGLLMLRIAALILPLIVAMPAQAQEVTPDSSFQAMSIRLESLGVFSLIAAPREIDGRLAVCGLYYTDGRTSKIVRHTPELLNRIWFTLADQKVRVNKGRFTRVRAGMDPSQLNAGCHVTGTAWQPAMAAAPFEIHANLSRPIRER